MGKAASSRGQKTTLPQPRSTDVQLFGHHSTQLRAFPGRPGGRAGNREVERGARGGEDACHLGRGVRSASKPPPGWRLQKVVQVWCLGMEVGEVSTERMMPSESFAF